MGKGLPLGRHLLHFGDFHKLGVQAVHEKRVNHLVDVLNAGVVHPSRAARFGIQCAFKHGSEDGRRNLAPVEIGTRVLQQQLLDFVSKTRDGDVLLAEQTAVHIREGRYLVVQIRVAFLNGRVKQFEQLYQGMTEIDGAEFHQIIMESRLGGKQARILGIEAKHQTHTKDVERAQGLGIGLVDVLLQQGIINQADNFARLHTDFQLAFQMLIALVHKELQAIILLFEVFQKDFLRLTLGLFHVIHPKLAEVASHNPTGT